MSPRKRRKRGAQRPGGTLDRPIAISSGRPPEEPEGQECAVLRALARCPFLSARDLALLEGGTSPAALYRSLARLARAGLVEWVSHVPTRYHHERLWYLADAGVRAAAALTGVDPLTYAARWGLGEAALLRRLCRLDHLVLSRAFFLDLGAALPLGAVRLTDWQPWPVRLAYSWRGRRRAVTLDGAGVLVWTQPPADAAGAHPEGRDGSDQKSAEVVLIWDDGAGLALSALRPQLVALLRAWLAARRALVTTGSVASFGAAGFPVRALFPSVLVVVARATRIVGVWRLAEDVARAEGMRFPALLVTTADAVRVEGPLQAIWRDEEERAGPLLSLLEAQAVATPVPGLLVLQRGRIPGDGLGAAISAREAAPEQQGVVPPVRRARARPLVQGAFAHRAGLTLLARAAPSRALDGAGSVAPPRAGGEADGAPARAPVLRGRALALLALRPAELRAMRCLGVLPLILAATLAELTGDRVTPTGRHPRRRWRVSQTLDRLLRAGLIDYDVPTHITADAYRRYFLTPPGLVLLATKAGLTPSAYCRLTGSIAGERLSARPGRPSPRRQGGQTRGRAGPGPLGRGRFPRRGALRGTRLAYYQRYLDHTVAVQEVCVGLVRAARLACARGLDHALEGWQGEWAALRYYRHGGLWQCLRPDAYGRYRVGTRTLSFFLELDRATSGLRDLAGKLHAYCDYRDSGMYARDLEYGTLAFPHLLVVTSGEGRLRNILGLAHLVPRRRLTAPLTVWVATAEDLDAHGLLGPIWRSAVRQPPHPLFCSPASGT